MATLNDLQPHSFMQAQMVEIAKIAHLYGTNAAPHFKHEEGIDVLIFMIIKIQGKYQGAIAPGNMFFSNPRFHEHRRAMLRTIFNELKVPMYCMVMEGWSVTSGAEDPDEALEEMKRVQPRDHPRRKSSLIIQAESREGDHLLVEYLVPEERVIADEPKTIFLGNSKTDAEKNPQAYHDGAMIGLLEPLTREEKEALGDMGPVMRAAVKAMLSQFKP